MEKIQVNEELKAEYLGLVNGAQTIEAAIGSAQFRLYKLCDQRSSVDGELKAWWEKVTETYGLDKTKDFYVDAEGAINIVEKPEQPAAPAAPAPEAPEAPAEEAPEATVDADAETIEDLK